MLSNGRVDTIGTDNEVCRFFVSSSELDRGLLRVDSLTFHPESQPFFGESFDEDGLKIRPVDRYHDVIEPESVCRGTKIHRHEQLPCFGSQLDPIQNDALLDNGIGDTEFVERLHSVRTDSDSEPNGAKFVRPLEHDWIEAAVL